MGLIVIASVLQDGGEQRVFRGPFHVIDGDTLAEAGFRLRLAGIDAPELDQTCRTVDDQPWPCGWVARDRLVDLVKDSDVECRGTEVDRYDRPLVICYRLTTNLNVQMVRAGFALSTGLLTYQREQLKAENEKRGIWAGRFQRPSQWRRERKLEHQGVDFSNILDGLKGVLSLQWL
ncbi:thermonuclease family protein [Rhizobium lemnae]|uniref:Thermonuclease family protein n=1 Tax=Rhizobium lemnae TaxID=1214924 RepID=A0ABV8EBF1_9HYPH|nr:thermonuclease family protein [Rhizobium lemnae]MCJ8506824.1 thermonuclease family protein [Rhizobium lemnae]